MTYAHDAAGRLTGFQFATALGSATSNAVYETQTMGYNANGQLTSMGWAGPTGPAVTIGYQYSATNNNGQITQMTDAVSGETVVYQGHL